MLNTSEKGSDSRDKAGESGNKKPERSFQIQIPQISLPKGGGAVRGIDEKFQVNAVTGTASFSIPLPFSPARGITPSLVLSYNSGSGNGIFGLGWMLSLSSVKRKTENGLPQYFDEIDSDTYIFSEADDLVPEFEKKEDGTFKTDLKGEYIILKKDSPDGLFNIRYYRPRIEGLFARIERWSSKASKEIKWRITSRENITTLFGWSPDSRIEDPSDPGRIFEWLPEFMFDDRGNCAHYLYKKEDELGLDKSMLHNRNRLKNDKITYANTYLERILYGNKTPFKKFGDAYPSPDDYLFSSVFDYGEYDSNSPYTKIRDWDFRPDAFSDYKAGFEIRTTRLCKRILFFHHFKGTNEYDGLVKSVNLGFDTNIEEDFTFLKSITHLGYIKKPDSSYSFKAMPSAEFQYQSHDWSRTVKTINAEDLVHAPSGLDSPQYQFVDLFNEGLQGILTEQANGWYYKSNNGHGRFGQAKIISPRPSFTGLGKQLQLVDLDADGGKQVVSFNAKPQGFFELNDENEWSGFQSFESMPNIDPDDPNTRMLDLNGDGKAEMVISEENIFTWYPSEGRKGYSESVRVPKPSDEEAGPYMVFADEKQTIFLADMSGDGLTDIVRIRNGEVCYWPNLGYGRFGSKVALDNSPVFDYPEVFNPVNIRLADIDDSGTTDIIYLGKNKFSCWKNLCGNRFGSTPFEIDSFPEIHTQSKISVIDLLGNGVACIVWSSPISKHANAPLKYIDLMNSRKPHIMVSYKNNIGKEVSLEYSPSTKFYIDDKAAGKPWVTKLHFPVQCISRTITEDKISGYRFVSEYKYHHGYYDHAEKEFRGFGMVEQTDAETFEHWKKGSAANVVEESLHQEPAVTKSWFHTGAFLGMDRILTQFKDDYWYSESTKKGFPVVHHEMTLPDARLIAAPGLNPGLIDGLSVQEMQEAMRACKTMGLRSETFALDAIKSGNTEEARRRELIPFSVATHNCIIELLQPKGLNKHPVYIVKESEAVTYTYERNPEDPRIAHNLNIKLDEYSNVLESAAVVYPRLTADTLLPANAQAEQSKTLITYTQNKYTNDVISDLVYNTRILSEVKAFELKSVDKSDIYYVPGDFEDILSDAKSDTAQYHEIDKPLIAGKAQKRLIEHIRSTFYRNDLTGGLPLHQLQTPALPFESYQMAYTPAMLSDIFGTKVDAALLAEGKFVHSGGDNNWWVSSGIVQHIKGAETASDAQKRFYTPVSYSDPFGAVTKVKHGAYYLFIEETEDASGNKTTVDLFNFRTLSPQRMKDANDNFSEAIADELSFVKAMAVYGKGDEADDLTGLTEFSDTTETESIGNIFNSTDTAVLTSSGKNLLKHASARFVYDFNVYRNTGKPVVVSSIVREESFTKNNNSAIQVSFEYSNGLGEVVMKKVQAEPGIAKTVIVNTDNSYQITEIDTSVQSPEQLRWIGNGRTVLNNMGNPVKQYEPFFSITQKYEDLKELIETGVTPVFYYDAMNRLIKTEFPDGTLSRILFDTWKQIDYDQNDTVLESSWYQNRINRSIDSQLTAEGKDPVRESEAASKASVHANTPSITYLDTLGRPFLFIANNGKDSSNNDIIFLTSKELDIESNLRKVVDARKNIVMQFKYDMLGNKVYQKSMDAGQRWVFGNIIGNPLNTWDERNHEFIFKYDSLQRPLTKTVKGGDGNTPLDNTYEKIIYGENLTNDKAGNLRTRAVIIYDTAGKIQTEKFDFNGNALITSRRFFAKYKDIPDWNDASPDTKLENENFRSGFQFDSLNRVISQTAPDNTIYSAKYNEAGLLESVQITQNGNTSQFVKNIDYNEKAQREKIIYGNDIFTNYFYDKQTFSLLHLETKRLNNDPLQDLYYTFDPVGNITHIEDKNIPVVFFNNQKITGIAAFTFDPLYRLTEATGREHGAQITNFTEDNWNDLPFLKQYDPNDQLVWRNYTQHYEYDAVGNILQIQHSATGGNWIRDYKIDTASNRLKNTSLDGNIFDYSYEYPGGSGQSAHGFISSMPHLQVMMWNFKDELQATARQKVTNGLPETTYYVYDSNGQRVRKITERSSSTSNPAKKNQRIYVGGIEIYREYDNADILTVERQTFNVVDGKQKIAIIETLTLGNDGSPSKLIRYQSANHIGSACMETDETARVISYEEFHPYGTTSYQATDKYIKSAYKRYRYSGMERDEESGLEYYGARYYIPWLGRWTKTDPSGIDNNINLYAFCKCNPVFFFDVDGREGKSWMDELSWAERAALWVDDVVGTQNLQNINNAVGGFGDTVSFGLTKEIRKEYGFDNVETDTAAYKGGVVAGYANQILMGGAGIAKSVAAVGVKQTVARVGVGVAVTSVTQAGANAIDPSGKLGMVVANVQAYVLPVVGMLRGPGPGTGPGPGPGPNGTQGLKIDIPRPPVLGQTPNGGLFPIPQPAITVSIPVPVPGVNQMAVAAVMVMAATGPPTGGGGPTPVKEQNRLTLLANRIKGMGQGKGATVEIAEARTKTGEIIKVAGLNSSAKWTEAQLAELKRLGITVAPQQFKGMGQDPHAEENIAMYLKSIGATGLRWSKAVVGEAGSKPSYVCYRCKSIVKDIGGWIEPGL